MFDLVHLNPDFVMHFGIHGLTIFAMVRFLYYPAYRDRDFAFSYIMFSLVVFVVVYFLKDITVSLGFTFGLFAVFGILRYRTETISTKEMTYLFIVIGLSMLNAVTEFRYFELLLINGTLLLITYLAQSRFFLAPEYKKLVQYERIDLIHPSRMHELKADLQNRTGLKITRVEVRNLDFVRDTASLVVFYEPDMPQLAQAETRTLEYRDSYEPS